MKCLQCGSNDIVKNVRAVDHGESNAKYDLSLEVYENPDAWIFKGAQEGTLRGNVCVACGFVMFTMTVKDAQKLKKYQSNN